jgi:hypothetical protein
MIANIHHLPFHELTALVQAGGDDGKRADHELLRRRAIYRTILPLEHKALALGEVSGIANFLIGTIEVDEI